MKYLLGLVFLFNQNVMALDQLELVGPGLTWHVIDNGAAPYFDHKISSDGRLIYTPMIGLKKIHVDQYGMYHSLTVFRASNSIGSPIWGGIGSTGAAFFRMLYAGFAFGGYIQNNNDFKAMGLVPFSLNDGANAFVPILGLEINGKFLVSDNVYIGFNNLISPIITNHTLSVGVNY